MVLGGEESRGLTFSHAKEAPLMCSAEGREGSMERERDSWRGALKRGVRRLKALFASGILF